MEVERTVTLACDYCNAEETFEYSYREGIGPTLMVGWQRDMHFFVGNHFTGTIKGHCCDACVKRIDRALTSIKWFNK